MPTKLEKVGDNEIKVTFSDDSTDTYNTVLVAIGRTADTKSLGLETVGVDANPKNGKIITTHEQTSTPNIYAVGDVMEGCPELTPVAIEQGFQDNVGKVLYPLLYRHKGAFKGGKEAKGARLVKVAPQVVMTSATMTNAVNMLFDDASVPPKRNHGKNNHADKNEEEVKGKGGGHDNISSLIVYLLNLIKIDYILFTIVYLI